MRTDPVSCRMLPPGAKAVCPVTVRVGDGTPEHPTDQNGVIVNQPLPTRIRGLVKLLCGELVAHQRLRSGAAWRLHRQRCEAAIREDPTARVEKTRLDVQDRTQVLVVDRDRELAELVAYVLTRAGIDFLAVHDAASALETLASRRPRVVVVDPCGLDLVRQLQASSGDSAIIVLTASESDDPRSATLGLVADRYLTKPFSCEELVSSIHACLLRGQPVSEVAASIAT
jgi:CheY-like chemotaxis protein